MITTVFAMSYIGTPDVRLFKAKLKSIEYLGIVLLLSG